MMLLDERLHAMTEFIPKNSCVVDVGSDHAYLVAWLVQNQLALQAIATDISEGACHMSRRTIEKFQLQEKISVRCGDGLQTLTNDEKNFFNVVCVAGMGGATIQNILQCDLSFVRRLILQPMNEEERLRRFLYQKNFCIIAEKFACTEKNQKIYKIIVAEKNTQNKKMPTDLEFQFGIGYEIISDEVQKKYFTQFLNEQQKKISLVLKNLQRSQKNSAQEKILFFEQKLNEIKITLKKIS